MGTPDNRVFRVKTRWPSIFTALIIGRAGAYSSWRLDISTPLVCPSDLALSPTLSPTLCAPGWCRRRLSRRLRESCSTSRWPAEVPSGTTESSPPFPTVGRRILDLFQPGRAKENGDRAGKPTRVFRPIWGAGTRAEFCRPCRDLLPCRPPTPPLKRGANIGRPWRDLGNGRPYDWTIRGPARHMPCHVS